MNHHLHLQLSLVSPSTSSPKLPAASRPAPPAAESNVVELPEVWVDRTALAASLGDRKAIGDLARAYHRELVSFARRACSNPHDGEDAVQEFWLALLEKRLMCFPPERGHANEWMRGVVQCLALGESIERWYAMRWHEERARRHAERKEA